jgi:hypothetical protein
VSCSCRFNWIFVYSSVIRIVLWPAISEASTPDPPTSCRQVMLSDFPLTFSSFALLQNGGVPGQPPTAGTANTTEPNGALSLSEALLKQLGLKLEMQKRPIPVLVIDHIEEKPTEN